MKWSVVLLGPPGAGKGTQARILAREFGLVHINSGSLLREEIRHETALGRAAGRYVERGMLVPDTIVAELVRNAIERASSDGLVIEGFPKTAAQAAGLDDILAEEAAPVLAAITLTASARSCRERMVARARIEGRADDTLGAIATRLREYNRLAVDLTAYYTKRELHHSVDADAALPKVTEAIGRVLIGASPARRTY